MCWHTYEQTIQKDKYFRLKEAHLFHPKPCKTWLSSKTINSTMIDSTLKSEVGYITTQLLCDCYCVQHEMWIILVDTHFFFQQIINNLLATICKRTEADNKAVHILPTKCLWCHSNTRARYMYLSFMDTIRCERDAFSPSQHQWQRFRWTNLWQLHGRIQSDMISFVYSTTYLENCKTIMKIINIIIIFGKGECYVITDPALVSVFVSLVEFFMIDWQWYQD